MASPPEVAVPRTLEGWYVLHDVYALDWASWRQLGPTEQADIAGEALEWLTAAAISGVKPGARSLSNSVVVS